jgi:hypothetical protein
MSMKEIHKANEHEKNSHNKKTWNKFTNQMSMKQIHKTNEHETNNYNAHIQNPFVKLKCPFLSISKFYNFKIIALLWLLLKKTKATSTITKP